jgi:hypothetical protein
VLTLKQKDNRVFRICCFLFVITLLSCNSEKKHTTVIKHVVKPVIIVDCNYTFKEAIVGTKAPKEIIDQLQLIDVEYYSTDEKIHKGQILTNIKMVSRLEALFEFMKKVKFPIAHAIPVVKYNWNDDLSMQDNNTYSFCYRDASYSKHARGMAIDINPFFNPVRWKEGYTCRKNKPIGATYDPAKAGTFYASHPVVLEFKKFGLRWGHNFTRKFDDHHFEN